MYNEKEILKQFGRNVKAERVRLGYSQENLAEKMGVNREYISRIERGIQNMSLLKITALANYLETNLNNLLRF
jgi:hypothetical protein